LGRRKESRRSPRFDVTAITCQDASSAPTIEIVNLKTLFTTVDPRKDSEVTSLVFDAKLASPGSVFVAIRGSKVDGHSFISEAIQRGAKAVVVEDPSLVPREFSGFVQTVDSSRRELARLSAAWQRSPSKELFTVGVTGTNGKTTTTHMIEAVLNHGGLPTGVIGTIDHHLGAKVWSTERTTPDPVVFQTRLRQFVESGAKAVAIEVTSHALDQSRVESVEFDVGLFTNLTRDHLDYHGTIEAYFESKLKFFTELLHRSEKPRPRAILHIDDPWIEKAFQRIVPLKKPDVWTFGQKCRDRTSGANHVDFEYEILTQGFDGAEIVLKSPFGERRLQLAMAGIYNIQNAVGAMATGLAAGFNIDLASKAIESLRGVNGRLESVENSLGLNVFVDYAHTDDAITAILRLLQDLRSASKSRTSGRPQIITVFGCGGDRDAGKRPLMMKAALGGSDTVIVTSDNPRTEDPEKIIDDAMTGASPSDHSRIHRVVDRRRALMKALEIATQGDVILIAGKGHEVTQTIGTQKFPFSDVLVVRELMEGSNVSS